MIEDHGHVPAVAWLPEPIPTTIAQALRHLPARSNADEPALAMHECDLWLSGMLSDGPVLYAEILTAGRPEWLHSQHPPKSKKTPRCKVMPPGIRTGISLYWQLNAYLTMIEQHHRGHRGHRG